MNASRRPPPDAVSPRRAADGVGKGLKEKLPPDGDGLGPVGEGVLRSLLDDSEQEEEEHRLFMRFTPRWRRTIRWFDDEKLDALQEIVEDHQERKTMRKFWGRIYRIAAIAVPVVFAWAQGFFDKAMPLLRQIAQLFKGGGA